MNVIDSWRAARGLAPLSALPLSVSPVVPSTVASVSLATSPIAKIHVAFRDQGLTGYRSAAPGARQKLAVSLIDWQGWNRMPLPTQPVVAAQAILYSPTAERGRWAASADPAADVLAIIVGISLPSGVTYGIWTPCASTVPTPADVPGLVRWHGPMCPVEISAALQAGAAVISAELTVLQASWCRLKWKFPRQWLDASVELAMVNRSAEWPEIAAWLDGAEACSLTERPVIVPTLSAAMGRWASLKGWTGVVGARVLTAEAIRGGLALLRVDLGVLAKTEMSERTALEDRAWCYDQVVNARGLPIDRVLAEALLAMGPSLGLSNPFPKIHEVLKHVGEGDRLRGAYHFRDQFTGRWGSWEPNVHNLRKPRIPARRLSVLVRLVRRGHGPALLRRRPAAEAAGLLEHLERCIIAAPSGMSFLVADQGQAEPRCLFTAAGLERVVAIMDQIDLYLHPELQQQMFGDVVAVGHPDAKRRRLALKIAIIACGFGMGADKLLSYASDTFGFDLQAQGVDPSRLVAVYRETFAAVPQLWKHMGAASVAAVNSRHSVAVPLGHFEMRDKDLHLVLASGRSIVYPEARVVPDRFKGRVLGYRRGGPLRGRLETAWGGILTQNAVTGTMRDVHAGHLIEMEQQGLAPCGHTHDDVVCLVADSQAAAGINQLGVIMSRGPVWMPALRLKAEAHRTKRLGAQDLPF